MSGPTRTVDGMTEAKRADLVLSGGGVKGVGSSNGPAEDRRHAIGVEKIVGCAADHQALDLAGVDNQVREPVCAPHANVGENARPAPCPDFFH